MTQTLFHYRCDIKPYAIPEVVCSHVGNYLPQREGSFIDGTETLLFGKLLQEMDTKCIQHTP